MPLNGPLATSQRTSVSQASPIGSGKSFLPGKIGASERAPQIRGLNVGSIRNGSGITNSGGGLSAGEESIEPPQSFLNSVKRSRIRNAQIARRPERIASDKRHARL